MTRITPLSIVDIIIMETAGDYNVIMYCCMYKGCDKTYGTKFNLKRHVDINHLNKKSNYCEECKRWFAGK